LAARTRRVGFANVSRNAASLPHGSLMHIFEKRHRFLQFGQAPEICRVLAICNHYSYIWKVMSTGELRLTPSIYLKITVLNVCRRDGFRASEGWISPKRITKTAERLRRIRTTNGWLRCRRGVGACGWTARPERFCILEPPASRIFIMPIFPSIPRIWTPSSHRPGHLSRFTPVYDFVRPINEKEIKPPNNKTTEITINDICIPVTKDAPPPRIEPTMATPSVAPSCRLEFRAPVAVPV